MKRLLYSLFLAFLISACDDTDSEPNLSQNEENLVESVQNSTWRISLFIEDGENETSDFSGITLRFLPNGSVEALEDGNILETGTWRTLTDDGRVEFWLDFSDDDPLDELSDDWYLISVSNTEIQLEEDDADDNDDRLTLTKI
ncbi:hypothetical protein [Algoriphagus namhaensis]